MPRIFVQVIRLVFRYGSCPHSSTAYAGLAFACTVLLGQVDYGIRLGRLATELADADPSGRQRAKVINLFETLTRHWKEPFHRGVERLYEGYRAGLASGDVDRAGLCLFGHNVFLYYMGANLQHLRQEAERHCGLLGAEGLSHYHQVLEYVLGPVRAASEGDARPYSATGVAMDEATIIEKLSRKNNVAALASWHVSRAEVHYYMRELDQAREHGRQALKYVRGLVGQAASVEAAFRYAMPSLERLVGASPALRRAGLDELKRARCILRKAAKTCPENYGAKSALVEAMVCWVRGKPSRALELMETAARMAKGGGMVQIEALSNEMAGRVHLERDEDVFAAARLRRAVDLYNRWGALHTARLLESEASEQSELFGATYTRGATRLLTQSSAGGGAPALDFVSVAKSAIAISREMDTDRLLSRVIEICAENAGAERGYLLLSTGEGWTLRAELSGGKGRPIAPRPLREEGELAHTIVRHVQRSGEDIIIDDAHRHEVFATDPHVAASRVKSVLCAQLKHLGQTRGLIYLENNFSGGVFTPERLELLGILLAQAAVSVENAALYESTATLNQSLRVEVEMRKQAERELHQHRHSLEEMVNERTRELREANDRLVDVSRRVGMAEVASGVLHNVGNVLNSVTVAAGLLRNLHRHSKIDGLSRAMALLVEHEDDLAEFLTRDPRGTLLPEYLEKVSGLLQEERDAAKDHLRTLLDNVEHISRIVASQLAHVQGQHSCSERFSLEDVIENAIDINATHLRRGGVEIIRDYDEVPQLTTDRHKVLQILVNLVSNAVHAMADVQQHRRATLRLQRVNSDRARVTIEDTGIGIPKENLERIFRQGFTTRVDGNGFGLHTSAIAAREIGGSLTAQSEGPGCGAALILEIPLELAGRDSQRSVRGRTISEKEGDRPAGPGMRKPQIASRLDALE